MAEQIKTAAAGIQMVGFFRRYLSIMRGRKNEQPHRRDMVGVFFLHVVPLVPAPSFNPGPL